MRPLQVPCIQCPMQIPAMGAGVELVSNEMSLAPVDGSSMAWCLCQCLPFSGAGAALIFVPAGQWAQVEPSFQLSALPRRQTHGEYITCCLLPCPRGKHAGGMLSACAPAACHWDTPGSHRLWSIPAAIALVSAGPAWVPATYGKSLYKW